MKSKLKTQDLTLIALSAALISICAWISIPATVPFTLQTFGVFLTVAVLGGKRGTITVLVYILLGLIGLPVFSNFGAGPGTLFGMTGGYIIGFIFSALVMWAFEKFLGTKTWQLAIAMIVGLIVCYAFGTIWFIIIYSRNVASIGLISALSMCVFPFIIPDLLKIALALFLSKRLRKALKLSQD